jgi:hypothetical protein
MVVMAFLAPKNYVLTNVERRKQMYYNYDKTVIVL